MRQNDRSKLQQALGDKKLMEQLANSPDAQALAGMLTQGTDQASLQKIAERAAKGDTAQLTEAIRQLMRDPEGARLIQKMKDHL